MFTLLTEEERQKVTREYILRRTIIILCAFILILVVGIIGLFPSYILSNVRQTEAFERTKVVSSVQQRNDDLSLQAWLKEINYKLQILSPAFDTDRPSDFIEEILRQKNAGIIITGFSLIKLKGQPTLSVNGIAINRQSLITFKDRFNSSEYFSDVVSPISNLAKDRDIDFQIKFSPI